VLSVRDSFLLGYLAHAIRSHFAVGLTLEPGSPALA
jgi:hypothetical protein